MSREVLIGVTAGIAAYKTCTLVSRLVQAGVGVTVMMTEHATQLVGPRTFQSLSGRPVLVDLFEPQSRAIPHVEAAAHAQLFCIAPATANILGKAANGLADDLLSTTILAFEGPVLFAPAMNNHMWQNKAVARNVAQLKADGYHFVGPEEGYLACGSAGLGRMAEPETILAEIQRWLES